jgi:acyl-CoA synthetase (AMP-forming)/AMP-acid ligase II
VRGVRARRWLLYCDDSWNFLVAFAALLQCGKEVLLLSVVSPDYVAEILDADTDFLSDRDIHEARHIPSLLTQPAGEESEEPPSFNPDESVIAVYTSGSTGRPQAVAQSFAELETEYT